MMLREAVIFIFMMLKSCIGTVVVQTNLGKIRGLEQPIAEGRFTYQFRKIPYAKPPVGNRRFSKPEAFDSWSGILDARSYGPSCVQNFVYSPLPLPNYDISEDCLFLNIFAPFDLKPASKRSVMVWIHGGDLMYGQGMLYDGSFLAASGNVIVVTMNYRLGVFGFFSNGDSDFPGNYGLWDQKMALEWINKNIESFGGNPNSVTIFGSSYGSFCASMLSLSPVIPRNLFQRVITQSGSALSPSVFPPAAMVRDSSELFVEIIGCGNVTNTTEFMECMRTLPADILLTNQGMLRKSLVVVDGEIIEEFPSILLSNKSSTSYSLFTSRDYLSGFNNADGSALVPQWITSQIEQDFNFTLANGVPTVVLCDFLGPNLTFDIYETNVDVEKTICEKYTDNRSIEAQGRRIVDLFSETFFYIPILRLLDIHSESNTTRETFQYLFKSTIYKHDATGPDYPWLQGALHGDEVMLLFGFKNYSKTLTDSEGKFVDLMMSYWTNFAKFGDPNGKGLPTWPEYGPEKDYITLDQDIEFGHGDFKNVTDFWLEKIPDVIKNTKEPIMPSRVLSDSSSNDANTISTFLSILFVMLCT